MQTDTRRGYRDPGVAVPSSGLSHGPRRAYDKPGVVIPSTVRLFTRKINSSYLELYLVFLRFKHILVEGRETLCYLYVLQCSIIYSVDSSGISAYLYSTESLIINS